MKKEVKVQITRQVSPTGAYQALKVEVLVQNSSEWVWSSTSRARFAKQKRYIVTRSTVRVRFKAWRGGGCIESWSFRMELYLRFEGSLFSVCRCRLRRTGAPAPGVRIIDIRCGFTAGGLAKPSNVSRTLQVIT